jgi:hypothetical protein
MFCPVCKAEYRAGYTHCADCDVDLVEALPKEESDSGEHDPFVPVWSGADPEFTEACGALAQAKIPYRVLDGEDTLFGMGNRPPHTILVPPSVEARAHDVLSPLSDEMDDTDEASSNGADSSETIPELDSHAEAAEPDTGRVVDPDDWDPDQATSEVWRGDGGSAADMIIASLRENGIHWRIDDGTGDSGIDPTEDEAESVVGPGEPVTVFVLPADEQRAKEIIREITTSEPL